MSSLLILEPRVMQCKCSGVCMLKIAQVLKSSQGCSNLKALSLVEAGLSVAA